MYLKVKYVSKYEVCSTRDQNYALEFYCRDMGCDVGVSLVQVLRTGVVLPWDVCVCVCVCACADDFLLAWG